MIPRLGKAPSADVVVLGVDVARWDSALLRKLADRIRDRFGLVVVPATLPDWVSPRAHRDHLSFDANRLLCHLRVVSLAPRVLAVTLRGLHTRFDGNVYGYASLSSGVGVASLARLGGERGSDVAFVRLAKVALHEVAHVYGLHHHGDTPCLLNQAFSVQQIDALSERLCPKCAIRFTDAVRRSRNQEKEPARAEAA